MRLLGRRALVIGVIAALTLTACSGADTDTTAGGNNGLEKTTIKVGILPIADVAALFIAQERGFFKAEGLTVKPEIVASTQVSIPKLVSGAVDITLGNYFSVLAAQEAKMANFRILADTFQAKQDVFDIVVRKDSPIQSVKDLKGKKISVAALNSIGTLAVDSTLRANGLSPEDVEYAPMPFPEAPGKLASGQTDAAWLTEPFLTGVQKDMGARKIADTMTGAMADFPIAGWTTIEPTLTKYPKAMAAFQRAIVKAQQIADSDRKAVEKVLPLYTQIKPETAAIITLGAYPSTLNQTRIQRVADLMLEYGYLKSKMNVGPLLVPMPQ
ncbi:sulfonate ABC transporter substrate-binding protein [Microbispora rosea subsp. aerata]|nr:ABC transporter substrate-binding protein [Microbispora rosea]GGO15514.1 sulfonate ABC transporter substrate-binding protein [Microbispora rosea subsp. aerata]GIH59147.1 sulfonate ABC transporter substrate-binding protein [Microbispora rosea subsp. aerata]GLJ82723.1 sulfonate ABC transporter substrate-binding protein [Microbispora rosea subsp. aerata]